MKSTFNTNKNTLTICALLVSSLYSPGVFSCEIPSRNYISKDSLNNVSGEHLNENVELDRLTIIRPNAAKKTCKGFTLFQIKLTTEHDGKYVVYDQVSGNIPSYLDGLFEKAIKVRGNSARYQIVVPDDELSDTELDVVFNFRVKLVDSDGRDSKWSKIYSANYSKDQFQVNEHLSTPALTPNQYKEIVLAAERLTRFLTANINYDLGLIEKDNNVVTDFTKFWKTYDTLNGNFIDKTSIFSHPHFKEHEKAGFLDNFTESKNSLYRSALRDRFGSEDYDLNKTYRNLQEIKTALDNLKSDIE